MALAGQAALYAAHIPVETAAMTAREFLAGGGASRSAHHGGNASEEVVCIDSTDSYYVFAPDKADAGFIIMAADDRLAPVAGYSPDGKFVADKLPPALKAWLSDYTRVAQSIADGKISYTRATRGGEAVAPMLKVKWNQDDPYNRLAPEIYGEKAPTGCVATAIAQVMKYYSFPPAGHGTAGEFSYNQDRRVELGHAYDWDNMLPVYEYDGYGQPLFTDAQADAVAILMRDIGFAVNMDYGYDMSGASSAGIAAAMCRHFNYSTDILFYDRGSFSTQAWTDEIRKSLLSGSPVIYSGTDGRNGHEFVCDGIDADDLLHINWGWGGYGDGYFDMNILSPEYLGIGAGDGAYYRDQDIVANIHPGNPDIDNTAWRAPMTITNISANAKVDADGRVNLDEYFGIAYRLYNSTGASVDSYVYSTALCISDTSGKIVVLNSPWTLGSFGAGYYYERTQPVYFRSMISEGLLPDGDYTMGVCVVSAEKQNNMTPDDLLPVYAGELNRIAFTVRDGAVYLADPSIAASYYDPASKALKISDVKVGTDNKIFVGAENVFNVMMTNVSSAVYSGYCNLFLVPAEKSLEEINLYEYGVAADNLFLYPSVEAECVIKGYSTPQEPGRYRLYMTDKNEKLIPEEKPLYVEVLGMPDDVILMTSALRLNRASYPKAGYIRFGTDFQYNNPFDAFKTDIELWACRKGASEESEVLLFRKEDVWLSAGRTSCSYTEWCEADALWYEPLGEYEAYIKYTDSEGNKVRMSGEPNSATFTLTACADGYQAVLAAPVVVNNGQDVPADNWSYFDVEFEIMTPTGMTVLPEDTYLDVYRSARGDDWVYSFVVNKITFDKTQLAPGDHARMKVNFLYRCVEGEEDLIGSPLYLHVNYFRTTDDYCRLQVGDYESSMCFYLVKPAGIDSVTDDSATDVRIYSLQGHMVFEGRYADAALKPGIYVVRRSDGTSSKVMVTE